MVHMFATVDQALLARVVLEGFHRHVVPRQTIHVPGIHLPLAEPFRELVREKDVRRGRQDELTARPPDAHVARAMNQDRETVRERQRGVQLRWNGDETEGASPHGLRPLKRVPQSAPGWRIPVDQDQLGGVVEFFELLEDRIDADLDAVKHAVGISVVAGGDDDAEIRPVRIHLRKPAVEQWWSSVGEQRRRGSEQRSQFHVSPNPEALKSQ